MTLLQGILLPPAQRSNTDMQTSAQTGGHIVTRDDLESLLAGIQHQITDSSVGIFGPDSITWRVNRECALFLGAGRAALLQLAHPWVAVALEQHSSLLAKPVSRFHNTFRIVFTMIFGTAGQAFAAARSLHSLHKRISGDLPSRVAGYGAGSSYQANDLSALSWVYATLVESAVLAYECVLPALTEPERETYYKESRVLAGLFGIPGRALPDTWTGFCTYVKSMSASDELGVDERSRTMARNLLSGAGSWIHPPQWYRALTVEWMPARFREEFGLLLDPVQKRAARNAQQWLPGFYRRMPAPARFVGPYLEACARRSQRPAGLITRASNRFWIGESKMPFGV
jgi:uncharacterized protein (DUF2236 family)